MIFSKRILYYFVALLMAVAIMIWISKSLKDNEGKNIGNRDYNEIIASGEINVVTDYNSIGYYVSGDTIKGFQVEMMQALEREWGIKVNMYLENSLEDNLTGLIEQQYDIVARSIPINSDLRDMCAFTIPITLNKQVLVQRKSDYNDGIEPLREHLELAKKKIHVPNDSPVILRLNNLSHEIGDTIFVVEDYTYDVEQLVIMVASGDIDFTVCDEKIADRLALSLPEIDVITDISFTQLESWAVRNNSDVLLDSLNSWLNSFKRSKEFKRIMDRYY